MARRPFAASRRGRFWRKPRKLFPECWANRIWSCTRCPGWRYCARRINPYTNPEENRRVARIMRGYRKQERCLHRKH
jgi:hypothetical protein